MATLSRPLPLELHEEIHKCLPLPNAIHILVNISSRAFVGINKHRMLRNVQRIKKSPEEYIGTLIGEDNEEDRGGVMIYKDIEWKPELNSLIRYGAWLTSRRWFVMKIGRKIVGMPENFVEKLLLHLANSSFTHLMLHCVKMNFGRDELPIPTFINPLLNKKKEHYRIGRRILFETVELEDEDGQIIQIFDGEYEKYPAFTELRLFLMNKTEPNNWFKILIQVDPSKKFIQYLEFSKWNMQSFDIANFIKEELYGDEVQQNGDKLEVKRDIYWYPNLDLFLRRCAGFSQFRHFKVKKPYDHVSFKGECYADFLINYICDTNHPEDLLESIDMNLENDSDYDYSPSIHKIWKYCHKGIEEGFDKKKFHILSAKTTKTKKGCLKSSSDGPTLSVEYALEFTLANGPTNGVYVFDVEVQFGNEGLYKIAGIKIQKRKIEGGIAELKCEDQIVVGMKRKAANDDDGDEDGPTCSAKLMKK